MATKKKTQDGQDAPARPKATAQRKDGIGPDPALLRGYMNPEREGKVFQAIRSGHGTTVSELMAATGLRNPTVKYFGISAGEANLIDVVRIGAEYRFVVRQGDNEATQKAKDLRAAVMKLRDDAAAQAQAAKKQAETAKK